VLREHIELVKGPFLLIETVSVADYAVSALVATLFNNLSTDKTELIEKIAPIIVRYTPLMPSTIVPV
jgi:hypothetical protein